MPHRPFPASRRPLWFRPALSHVVLNLIVASYIAALLNLGLWARLWAQFSDSPAKAVVFGVGIWALTLLLLELFGPSRLQKPVAAVLILVAAGAQYFERSMGVMIDREMVRNILETTAVESRHLVTPHMVGVLFLSGVLPAALLFWPRVDHVTVLHQLWRWPLGVALCALLMVGALFLNFKDYSAMLRQRHDLMAAYQPGASLWAVGQFAREEWKTADPVAAPVGTDARSGSRLAAAEKPVLLVLFVGETVRAQNFGLNGYARDTTPGLRKREVIAFQNATSCGTSTAVSVPCMFSPVTRAEYSRAAYLGHETLLDVLGHAGVVPLWWDNNTGDQKVAARTGWHVVDATLSPDVCVVECTDEAFLPVIDKILAEIETDTVLVLHMIRSHGPSYYLRYPEDAAFLPDCRRSQFSDCTTEEIVNAYDNSIVETDHVLSVTIDRLAAAGRVIPAMVYISDHGESLGENGLFLHAAPAFMAPAEQTRVPFVIWLSDRFAKAMNLDTECLARLADDPVSHDNVFHTVLGLLDIETSARQDRLDLTAGCRGREVL